MQRAANDLSPSDRRFLWSWTTGILLVHGIVLLVLVGLLTRYPAPSQWISQAVQAEFVGDPPPVIAPMQLAEPGGQMRTVRANYGRQAGLPNNPSAWSAAAGK